MSSVEGYSSAVNGSAGNSAPVGGRRRSHKLRVVKKKTVRRMLAKQGLKMRGGAEPDTPAEAGVSMEGGRRRKHRKSHKRTRRGRSLFHF
jgi:hypothetical protein